MLEFQPITAIRLTQHDHGTSICKLYCVSGSWSVPCVCSCLLSDPTLYHSSGITVAILHKPLYNDMNTITVLNILSKNLVIEFKTILYNRELFKLGNRTSYLLHM